MVLREGIVVAQQGWISDFVILTACDSAVDVCRFCTVDLDIGGEG